MGVGKIGAAMVTGACELSGGSDVKLAGVGQYSEVGGVWVSRGEWSWGDGGGVGVGLGVGLKVGLVVGLKVGLE